MRCRPVRKLASMKKTFFSLAGLVWLLFCNSGEAQSSSAAIVPEPEERDLFWNLGSHAADSFLGWTSVVHLGAVASTWLLVETDIDADVRRWAARQDEAASLELAFPGLTGGMVAPVAVPLLIYLAADEEKSCRAAAAAAQAVVLAFVTANLLKGVTGRTPPDADSPVGVEDRSRAFRFGLLRGGLWDGWPSGHSINNMALSAALASYYREQIWLQVLVYCWAAYVMTSVVIGARGGVHWLSDAVAGGAMGWAIGWTVGSGFRGEANEARAETNRMAFWIVPVLSRHTVGVSVAGRTSL